MIKDRLKNAKTYYLLSEDIKKGLQWLENNNLETLEAGRYYIDNDRIYVNIDQYETKDDANYEAHRKYIDIQYMIKGSEYIGVTDIESCSTCIDYDSDKDIEFFKANNEFQTLKTGEFLILYPQDAHKPCIKNGDKTFCKKAVVKIKIN